MDGHITWDPWKALANERKHGVSFREAATVFDDPAQMTMHDPLHSQLEPRIVSIGTSAKGRLLVVVFTDDGDTVRIITARRATSPERRTYEET